MLEKRRLPVSENSKIAHKMSEFYMYMYNTDFKLVFADSLDNPAYLSSKTLCQKQCRLLPLFLYGADTATLLAFTVSLGRAIWESLLRVKRRIQERELLNKTKQRERKLGGNPRLVVMVVRRVKSRGPEQAKGNMRVRLGFRLRPVYPCRVVVRHRSACRVVFGSRMHRLSLAMVFLSFRNICVTSKWEFWVACLVKQVFGFWKSIAIGGVLNGSFTSVANGFGFDVVSSEVLERLQSCLQCSSTTRYLGSGRKSTGYQ